MIRYYMDLRFRADGHANEQELEDALDEVIAHLSELDGAIDPDVSASLDTGKMTFSLCVDEEDEPRALAKGLTLVRTAIHASEGNTPGWERLFKKVEQTIREGDESEDVIPA